MSFQHTWLKEGVGNPKEQTEFWPVVKSVMQNVRAPPVRTNNAHRQIPGESLHVATTLEAKVVWSLRALRLDLGFTMIKPRSYS